MTGRYAYIFLKLHDYKFQEKASIISRVQPMPEGKKQQGGALANVPIAHELQSLVDIATTKSCHLKISIQLTISTTLEA
jgi:hypothetical protein